MKMEMTQRDRKLLVFLSIFVIVVGFGYWGIRPLLKSMAQIKEDKEIATMQRDENDIKISLLPLLEVENQELEEEIIEVRKDFYQVMTADEIDKYFTNKVLSYNLNSYDLTIEMPTEEASTSAYVYAKEVAEDEEEDEDSYDAANVEDAVDAVDAYVDDEDDWDAWEADVATGIYKVNVSMRLGGDPERLQKLIDDLSADTQMHQIVSYSWENNNNVNFNDDGTYDFVIDRILHISIDLYMCEE